MIDEKEHTEMVKGVRKSGMPPMRYCMKIQLVIHIDDTIALKCWECPHHVLNEGICDPI